MSVAKNLFAVVVPFLFLAGLQAADKPDLKTILGQKILPPDQTRIEWQKYTDARVPKMPAVKTAADWEKLADKMRADTLEKIVYAGEAARWRDAKTNVEWLDTIEGGPGYRIKKLRYEAVPGMWIPALLYEPEKMEGKVPGHLAVNGHDGRGKASPYKQIRCINLAKRGMPVLNLEWLGMGQLRTDGFFHGRMNQLDLCGTSGLAPFYLCMKRGLDILLAHEHVDPERVSVSGLSGGGWQTIFISALDTRVKLCNPVAGYSSVHTRVEHFKDLGDSEQTPNDLATVTDYLHLTAMLAPRPALLTYNVKDDCCFEAGYALPPLLEAASPIYHLYGKDQALRAHVNHYPGTHNYDKDNREEFYRFVGDHFFPDSKTYQWKEIPSDAEVKSIDALNVPLPADNHDFHTLAMSLVKHLPRQVQAGEAAAKSKDAARTRLHQVVRAKDLTVKAEKVRSEEKNGLKVTAWKLRMADAWTVPVLELVRGEAKGTTVVVHDGGRQSAAATVEKLLASGQRVLVVDPFYIGECHVGPRDYLFALVLATVGDRPLGLQASQISAVARWSVQEHKKGPVHVAADGPRSALLSLVAAALEPDAIGALELRRSFASLKEVIEKNRRVDEMAEVFCFGLLETFDIPQLRALAAPRLVRFAAADR